MPLAILYLNLYRDIILNRAVCCEWYMGGGGYDFA